METLEEYAKAIGENLDANNIDKSRFAGTIISLYDSKIEVSEASAKIIQAETARLSSQSREESVLNSMGIKTTVQEMIEPEVTE